MRGCFGLVKENTLDDKSSANQAAAAAALIADSAIFKASGKLDKVLTRFRDVYGTMSDDEIAKMMTGVKVVYKPQDK